jgi:succinate dehydrogenase/fumarate reductase flavoprotein subunit
MLPFQSGTLGGAGIRVAENGATTIPGLYAAGNTSDGAFMGLAQALNLCAVGGWYAGEAAGEVTKAIPNAHAPQDQIDRLAGITMEPMERSEGTSFTDTRDELESLYGTEITEVLNAERLESVIAKVQDIRRRLVPVMKAGEPHDLAKVLGMGNFLQCMEISLQVVQRRTESRGNVLREDYPYMDNEGWLKYTFAKMGGNGGLDLFEEPIPADEHHRMPEQTKVLHPFFRS